MAIQARKKLRDIMRSKRKLLCTTTAEAAAKAAAEKLLNLPMLKNCQHIGVYLSNDGEIQTDFLIHELHLLGKACYLPVLDTHQFHHLQFAKYIPGESLTKNRYQISEPYLSEQNACLPPLLDLVLIPVVAFDKHAFYHQKQSQMIAMKDEVKEKHVRGER